jgi:hypothetical protein
MNDDREDGGEEGEQQGVAGFGVREKALHGRHAERNDVILGGRYDDRQAM